jgi:hypothetical protein
MKPRGFVGRPRGDVRVALGLAALELADAGTPLTWRAAAERAQVGFAKAREAWVRMERAGEIERVDVMATGRRPAVVHAVVRTVPVAVGQPSGALQLADALAGWARKPSG